MAKKPGPNKENLEATRRNFLSIARKEFSAIGYYNASTANIVVKSGMARGSLYYHFGDKKGLFRAVYEELMMEMQKAIKDMPKSGDPWERFIASCMKLMDLCTENATRRIIIDVHTALTYKERVDILQRTLLLELSQMLQDVAAMGYFKEQDLKTLATMIFGILSESTRSFELANDVKQAREVTGKNFITFMERARA